MTEYTKVESAEDLDSIEWTQDDGTLDLKVTDPWGNRIHLWLHDRPEYCDRGHFDASCSATFSAEGIEANGIAMFDHADGFPRYFMSLQRAKDEAIDFLKWRLFKVRVNEERIKDHS